MGTYQRQTSELLCEGEAAEADRGVGRKWEQVKARRSIGTLNGQAGIDSHDLCAPGVEEAVACIWVKLRVCSPDRVQRI